MTLLEQIEALQNKPYGVIDIFPETISAENQPIYQAVEQYFLRTSLLPRFAESIVTIILRLVCYERAEIFITEAPENHWLTPYSNKWLSGEPIEILAAVFKHIVTKDVSSAQILLIDANCLISLDGGFTVSVYQPNEQLEQYLLPLVQAEGLFYHKINLLFASQKFYWKFAP